MPGVGGGSRGLDIQMGDAVVGAQCGTTCAAMGHRLETVESIFDEKTTLVVLQRPLQASIAQYLQSVSAHLHRHEQRQRVTVARDQAHRVFWAFPEGPGLEALKEDYRWLLDLFSTIADSEELGVRLAVTTTRTCPRFHVDQVTLRMICTWQGPATEWLEHSDVDRRSLGRHGSAAQGHDPDVVRDAPIRQLSQFDVGLMKGEAWPGNAGRGLVHRSPDPAGEPRVMITLDALS